MAETDVLEFPRYSREESGEKTGETKHRIKIWMGACLVLTAALIDLIEVILTFLLIGIVLNPIISAGANFLFWIWFKMLDVSFFGSAKNFATFLTEAVLEEIPAADALPILTIGVLMIVLFTRAEDSSGIIGKAAKAVETATGGAKKPT